jgi:hypothetical protein
MPKMQETGIAYLVWSALGTQNDRTPEASKRGMEEDIVRRKKKGARRKKRAFNV